MLMCWSHVANGFAEFSPETLICVYMPFSFVEFIPSPRYVDVVSKGCDH